MKRVTAFLFISIIVAFTAIADDNPGQTADAPILVDKVNFEYNPGDLSRKQTVLTSDGWYMIKKILPTEKGEGMCGADVYDTSARKLWSGEIGCTAYLGPTAGFFFSYNPIGDLSTAVYNLALSKSPLATPRLSPSEHVFSNDGTMLLLGGGIVALYDNSGRKLITARQRLDMDIALTFSGNDSLLAVADLLKDTDSGSYMVPEGFTREIDYSRNKNYATILAPSGKIKTILEIPSYARSIGVSDDGKLLAVADAAAVHLFKSDGSIVWEYRIPGAPALVKSIAVDNEGNVLAVINLDWQNERKNTRNLYYWDKQGKLADSIELDRRRALDFYDIYLKMNKDTVTFQDDRGRRVYSIN